MTRGRSPWSQNHVVEPSHLILAESIGHDGGEVSVLLLEGEDVLADPRRISTHSSDDLRDLSVPASSARSNRRPVQFDHASGA